MDVAHGVFKKLIVPFLGGTCSQNDPLDRLYQMRCRNKVIAIVGCIAFMASPLPFVCGMVGEGWIRWQGRRKWQEVSSEWLTTEENKRI
ncbi:hypothetical protein C5S35_15640 [Candidatus Methanophagaceae archaeon]|nr:hypothetical protein C5S35_15640 [Methanophagales archaeon]